MRGAFFIDKDGTLVDNSGYPDIIPSDTILEQVVDGLKYIKNKGYKIIIVSNQPWIAKKRLTIEQVEQTFKSLINKLNEMGVSVDDYFYCPHQTSDNCECKKPKPKLVLEAAEKHNIDLNDSFFIGDMDADILLGKNLGIKTVLVLTGMGRNFQNVGADYVLNNINEIQKII